ncbi:MAG: component of SufBCD complex [Paracoccaceae bacterium]
MDWYSTVFELIDMRSFSNLWFWISLAVTWSTASHWVMGVPFDMIARARKHGGQVEIDLEDIVRINSNRLVYIEQISGLWLLGITCFAVTGLCILGFFYRIEIAQALFLIGFPMSFVGALNIFLARSIKQEQLTGEALRIRLTRHRTIIQAIGMVSICITAVWGMYQNLAVGPFGG